MPLSKVVLVSLLKYSLQLLQVLQLLQLSLSLLKKKRKKPRQWVRELYRRRGTDGHYAVMYRRLRSNDREYFYRFLRMSPERFNHLFNLVSPHLKNRRCRSRKPISKQEMLVVTLRYLATGDSQMSQSFNFCISRSKISRLVREVCQAIWKGLHSVYLKQPATAGEWKEIATQFEKEWDLPNVLGALDGKHVEIQCPKGGGSNFFNYLKYHSVVLMAVCDAHYRFTYVDIGAYGHDNDAAIFANTELFAKFNSGQVDLPPARSVGGEMLPYVLVGDDIFSLKPWLIKPYPAQGLTASKRIFNYRLSRSRRTVENSFGILSARWRIFRGPILAKLDLVDLIIQASVCLHNYLLLHETACYLPTGFADSTDGSNNFLANGQWRQVVGADANPVLTSIGRQGSHNSNASAKETRDAFCRYVNGEGAVPWQGSSVNPV